MQLPTLHLRPDLRMRRLQLRGLHLRHRRHLLVRPGASLAAAQGSRA